MVDQLKVFQGYEKLMKYRANERAKNEIPSDCRRCANYRKDFRYRKCTYAKCPYGNKKDVFRKKPLKYEKYKPKENSKPCV